MAYIGTKPTIGNFQICDAISVVNGQAAYTMQVGSVNVIPQSANHMIVSLNGTIQKPNSSFTVSSSTITFSSNLVTNDVIDFIQILGDVLDLGVPSDATVTTAKVVDDAVTLAKMASGTDGNIISYDASGNPVAVATGNDGQVLTSTGAGSPPAFETLPAGGITEIDMWRVTSTFSGYQEPLASNWERADTDNFSVLGTGLTQSSGIFTFPSTGYYLITFQSVFVRNGDKRNIGTLIQTTNDNSSYTELSYVSSSIVRSESDATYQTGTAVGICHVTNTSNDKVRFATGAADVTVTGDGNAQHTGFTCIKLADT